MSEDQIAAQVNADSGVCSACPHSTDTCRTEGCVLPVADEG